MYFPITTPEHSRHFDHDSLILDQRSESMGRVIVDGRNLKTSIPPCSQPLGSISDLSYLEKRIDELKGEHFVAITLTQKAEPMFTFGGVYPRPSGSYKIVETSGGRVGILEGYDHFGKRSFYSSAGLIDISDTGAVKQTTETSLRLPPGLLFFDVPRGVVVWNGEYSALLHNDPGSYLMDDTRLTCVSHAVVAGDATLQDLFETPDLSGEGAEILCDSISDILRNQPCPGYFGNAFFAQPVFLSRRLF
ncbi:hypothetical protein ACFL0V_07205 [Nanoarchaeota archaeon]